MINIIYFLHRSRAFFGRYFIWCAFIAFLAMCSAEKSNSGNNTTFGNSDDDGLGQDNSSSSNNQSGTSGSGGKVVGGQSNTTTNTTNTKPVALGECQSGKALGLSDAALQKLMKGSGKTGKMRWLYPYDGTIFPRGMLAPLFMWEGGPADAVYLHIKSSLFEYKGCFKPTDAGQLQLPQKVWDTACAQSQGPSDPFTIELTVISTGTVTGPIAEKIMISGGTLKGSVFYNSYSSHLNTGQTTQAAMDSVTDMLNQMGMGWASGMITSSGGMIGNGAILRIPPGKNAELFLSGAPCTGCHSVSANGTRLVSAPGLTPVGFSYALTPTTAPNPPSLASAPSPSFPGIYPDGSMYVSTANPLGGGGMNMQGLSVGHNGNGGPSLLYETDTGAEIPNSGIPNGAMMPSFSPDGTLLAFNDASNGNTGHTIAVMDFDAKARKASNYRVVYTDDTMFPGWPFFLPDNRALIITRGNSPQFDGMGLGMGGFPMGPTSDIYIIDLKTLSLAILAKAMGYNTTQDAKSDKTYLPFGAEELHHNFFPTIQPVAAGGYFWLFFDSLRHYGALGSQRQLWGVAIDVLTKGEFAGSYSDDHSHPAFYLTGQEFGTGNHRAFTSLDPCRKDGEKCTTGIDCCSGYCTDGKCGRPKERCAETDEACKSQSDCCNPEDYCISGFCGQVILK